MFIRYDIMTIASMAYLFRGVAQSATPPKTGKPVSGTSLL